jgi:16S rRNA (uracil1498-N3)-methyltransferase
MRTVRIYQPGTYTLGESIELSPGAAHHIGKVLRMQPKEQLTLFCGDNREFTATITHAVKKSIVVHIDNIVHMNRESSCSIHLAQGIPRGDKMEWIVQKAIELGVTQITPLLTQHGSVKHDQARLEKKQHQWQAIAIHACEQSGRNMVPAIQMPCSFKQYLQPTDTTSTKWILDPYSSRSFNSQIKPSTHISLLIGPEGGFHEDEIQLAKDAGFQPLSLGPRILRTETATISALSILQALAGDL